METVFLVTHIRDRDIVLWTVAHLDVDFGQIGCDLFRWA